MCQNSAKYVVLIIQSLLTPEYLDGVTNKHVSITIIQRNPNSPPGLQFSALPPQPSP